MNASGRRAETVESARISGTVAVSRPAEVVILVSDDSDDVDSMVRAMSEYTFAQRDARGQSYHPAQIVDLLLLLNVGHWRVYAERAGLLPAIPRDVRSPDVPHVLSEDFLRRVRNKFRRVHGFPPEDETRKK